MREIIILMIKTFEYFDLKELERKLLLYMQKSVVEFCEKEKWYVGDSLQIVVQMDIISGNK